MRRKYIQQKEQLPASGPAADWEQAYHPFLSKYSVLSHGPFVICAFYLDFKNSSRVVFLGLSTLCSSGPWQVLLGTKVRGLYGGGQRDNRRAEFRTISSFLSRIFELLPQLLPLSPRTSWRVWSGKNNISVTPSTLLRLKLAAVCMAPGPAWLLLALVDTLGIFCAVSPHSPSQPPSSRRDHQGSSFLGQPLFQLTSANLHRSFCSSRFLMGL